MTQTGHGTPEWTSTTSGTRDVLCPFFLAHGVREIHCEAYEDRCRCVMRYRVPANKDEHMRIYCCGNYKYCEHYLGLMRHKYDEEE